MPESGYDNDLSDLIARVGASYAGRGADIVGAAWRGPVGAVRFAFWGRVSTEDNQDPKSSRAWQVARATALIEPHGGQVVAEFFDQGQSRSVPPQRRPEASRLLAALADPDRGFGAVVIGEPQRAFYGSQFGNTFPLFAHWGVPLWVPEVGGAIDPGNEAHDLIMSVFGGISKGDVTASAPESAQSWLHRRRPRAASSVAGRLTGTCSSMRGLIPTPRGPPTEGAFTPSV